MRIRKKVSSSRSFVLALIMLVALIAVIIVIQRVMTRGLPADKLSAFTGSLGLAENNYIQFDSLKQQMYKKPIAGFWESLRDTVIDSIPLQMLDRVEIKGNGYIWQVIRFSKGTDSLTTMHVVNSYALPYGLVKKDTSQLVVQIRLIRQVYFAKNDTSYGESNLDLVSTMVRKGDTLTIDGTAYHVWKSSSLAGFFPSKTLGWVDSLRLPECRNPGRTLTRPFH